jgi:hypothetical protein
MSEVTISSKSKLSGSKRLLRIGFGNHKIFSGLIELGSYPVVQVSPYLRYDVDNSGIGRFMICHGYQSLGEFSFATA